MIQEVQQLINPDQLLAVMMLAHTTTGIAPDPAEASTYVSIDETPLPTDIWPTRLAEAATGQDFVGPIEALVSSAVATQRTLAFLPVHPGHERLVEEHIREHSIRRKGRKLLRRGTRKVG